MAKEFNITGTCIPGEHYMADTSGKLKQVMELVEKGKYFIINRPRQYGKTTTLYLLTQRLRQSEEYLPIKTSFAGVGDDVFETEPAFYQMVLSGWQKQLRILGETALEQWISEKNRQAGNLAVLSETISELCLKAHRKVVLLIDEVDKSSNNQLFVSFLGMLRDKFLSQKEGDDRTFHSVVLAGVHDVQSLKLKIRPEAEAKFNSPWNIATDFKVDMSLQPAETEPMLRDYARERSVEMDIRLMAERLHYFTSGYPFLVSKLCKIMDEEILPQKSKAEWTDEDLETAVNLLLKESNTNFDSLAVNLENWPELYDVVFKIIMQDAQVEYNLLDPVINLGVLYGMFRPDQGRGNGIKIHNRIYQEIIFNYMTSRLNRSVSMDGYDFQGKYLLPGNRLDLEKVLLQFQAFMKEQQSKHDHDFLERNGRLLFLAFLKPIINGGGWDFKEPQISDEKRLDVAITFFQHKYVVELKIWRGEAAHQKGLKQLADYLDLQRLEEGFLLIFDHSKKKAWKHEPMEAEGKKVLAVWV